MTHKAFNSFEEFFDDDGNALVSQQTTSGTEMRSTNETRIQAEDGGKRRVQSLKWKNGLLLEHCYVLNQTEHCCVLHQTEHCCVPNQTIPLCP